MIFHSYQCLECHKGISTGVPDEDEPQFCDGECMTKYVAKHGNNFIGVIRNEVNGGNQDFIPAALSIIVIAILIKVLS